MAAFAEGKVLDTEGLIISAVSALLAAFVASLTTIVGALAAPISTTIGRRVALLTVAFPAIVRPFFSAFPTTVLTLARSLVPTRAISAVLSALLLLIATSVSSFAIATAICFLSLL